MGVIKTKETTPTRRILRVGITGVRGFIGSHLANKLVLQGHTVIGFDNLSHPSENLLDPAVQAYWGDVRNMSDCYSLANDVDVVFHLAAEISVDKSIKDPDRVIDVNLQGTRNMLEACNHLKKTLIFASSSEVYGSAETPIQNEKHPMNGHSPYAATKTMGDRLCHAYHKTFGTDVRIVRAFNVCGEGQSYDSYGAVIAIFVKNILRGNDIYIYGDGKQTRDYTHVSDTVNGYIVIMEKGKPGEVYNIATGKDYSVNYLANKLQQIAKKKVVVEHVAPRPGEVMKLRGDATKLRKLGWKPEITFDEALKKSWRVATL